MSTSDQVLVIVCTGGSHTFIKPTRVVTVDEACEIVRDTSKTNVRRRDSGMMQDGKIKFLLADKNELDASLSIPAAGSFQHLPNMLLLVEFPFFGNQKDFFMALATLGE